MGQMKGLKTVLMLVGMVLIVIALPLIGACTTEKVVEVPVEKVVEKEVVKEVPVEKVVVKEVPVTPKPPIKFGVLTDLTGPYAVQTKPAMTAYEDWFTYVNEQGGIAGHEVEWSLYDHAQVPAKIMSVYEKAKDEGMVIHFSHTTAECLMLGEKNEKDMIPQIALASGIPWLVNPGWVYSWYPPHENSFAAVVEYWLENWKESRPMKLSIITMDSPTGRKAVSPEMLEWLEEQGVDVVTTDFVAVAPVSVEVELLRAKDAGADRVYGINTSVATGTLMRDAHRLGMTAPEILIGSYSGATPRDVLKLAGQEAAEGYTNTWYLGLWNEDEIEGIRLFKELSKKYRGKEETDMTYIHAAVMAQMGTEAVRMALEKVPGDELNGAAVKEYGLDRFSNFSPLGMCPPLTYGPGKRLGTSNEIRIMQLQDGEIIEVKSYHEGPWIGFPEDYPGRTR